jgi:DoxX-like family
MYQGLVPKVLRPAAGEIEILRRLGLFPGREATVLSLLGFGEIAFGLLFLILWRRRSLFAVNAVFLAALLVAALPVGEPLFSAAFNPLTLTIAMWALSLIGWWSARDLPSAGNCLRREPELEN